MDALRVFDEKLRDGEIVLEEALEEDMEEVEEEGPDITADLLGLDNLDSLEKKIKGVHSALNDSVAGTNKVKEGTATAIPVGQKKKTPTAPAPAAKPKEAK